MVGRDTPEIMPALRVVATRRGAAQVIVIIIIHVRHCSRVLPVAPRGLAPQRYAFGRCCPIWQASITPEGHPSTSGLKILCGISSVLFQAVREPSATACTKSATCTHSIANSKQRELEHESRCQSCCLPLTGWTQCNCGNLPVLLHAGQEQVPLCYLHVISPLCCPLSLGVEILNACTAGGSFACVRKNLPFCYCSALSRPLLM